MNINSLKIFFASLARLGTPQYSQLGEELILLNTLGRMSKDIPKTYLDIGAFHSWRGSNTYRLYRLGWKGIVVDPNPIKLKSFEKDRPLDTRVQAAVVPDSFKADHVTMISPSSNDCRESIVKIHNTNCRSLSDEYTYEAPALSITNLIKDSVAKLGPLGFVNMDVEGYEQPILNSWPFELAKPIVFCVEHMPGDYSGKCGVESVLHSPLFKLFKDNNYLLVSICDASLFFVDSSFYVPPS